MKIGPFDISDGNKCMIVAELSANHGGDLATAIDTIKAAAQSGADAIKLQTYTPETLTIDCDNDYFKIKEGTIWDGKKLFDLYCEAYTPWEWHEKLFQTAEDEGLICFSTPFDFSSVDFLEKFNPPAYKIASFEITDIPLISYVASKGRPIIISTGIAGEEDIRLALSTCKEQGNEEIMLLKCTSSYPAPFEEMNLVTMPDMARRFNVLTGLSDHSPGTTVAVASVALGARLIEKHFILNKDLKSPDAAFSLDPDEFSRMTEDVRKAEKALGSIRYDLTDAAKKSRRFSRSLFAVKDISKGEKISRENVRSIRPGDGMHPKHYDEIIGKTANRDIAFGTPMKMEFLD